MGTQNQRYRITSYNIHSGEFQTLKDNPSFYTYNQGSYIIETENMELSALFNEAYEKDVKINTLELKVSGPNLILEDIYVIDKNQNQYTIQSIG